MNAPLTELPGFSAADMAGGHVVAVPGFWAGLEAAGDQSAKAVALLGRAQTQHRREHCFTFRVGLEIGKGKPRQPRWETSA